MLELRERLPDDVVDEMASHREAWRRGKVRRDRSDYSDDVELAVTGFEYDREALAHNLDLADDLLVERRRAVQEESTDTRRRAVAADDDFFIARLERRGDSGRFLPEPYIEREPHDPELETFWSDVRRAFDEPDTDGVCRLGYLDDEERWQAGDRADYSEVFVENVGAVWISKELLYRARRQLVFNEGALVAPWVKIIERSEPAL